MLVLNRKVGQKIQIGPNITVTIVRIQGNQVRVGIDAPSDVAIVREEAVGSLPEQPPQRLALAGMTG